MVDLFGQALDGFHKYEQEPKREAGSEALVSEESENPPVVSSDTTANAQVRTYVERYLEHRVEKFGAEQCRDLETLMYAIHYEFNVLKREEIIDGYTLDNVARSDDIKTQDIIVNISYHVRVASGEISNTLPVRIPMMGALGV